MNPVRLRPFLLVVAVAAPLAGCQETVRVSPPVAMVDEPGAIVVRERPPVLREEIVPTAPGPGLAWRPGYWRWADGWAWQPGRYVERPHAEAIWVPGHWAERRWGWAWVPGHWM